MAEQITYQEYKSKPKAARARLLDDNEVVKCYNGIRIGQKGDYVVIDDEDRVMIMKSHKFEKTFREVKR